MILYGAGFGSGSRECMTAQACEAIENSDIIVGYKTYADIIKNFYPDKKCLSNGMRMEKERVLLALEEARNKNVSLVCSGDSELYGMAGLAYELSADFPDVEIVTVAGVSAAFSGGAILGAPLTHDTAIISLSDLLTPAETIENRLFYAAKGDFVIVLYNPSSKHRPDHLKNACDILLKVKSPDTVCGFVRNIGRDGQESGIMSLEELRNFEADMFTTIFVGNSQTKVINGKMVTPRGYKNV